MSSKIRILVAEDHLVARVGVSAIINRQTDMVVVAEATNGKQAVERFRKHIPDITLLDMRMPVLDGWGFRAQQQLDPSCASIPVVVVSADGSVSQKAGTLGAVDYLKKPVDIYSLLDILKRHC